METPLKFIITLLIFWLCFGGLLQLFNLSDEQTGNELSIDSEKGGLTKVTSSIGFIWDMMTFNVKSMPSVWRSSLNTFFIGSLVLSIYVLFRSGS